MGFRFRKGKSLFGGAIRINFSKSGIGYSYGGKGARVSKMANGKTRTTFSLPGTGISYVTETSSKRRTKPRRAQQNYSMTRQDAKNACICLGIIFLFIITCIGFGFIPGVLFLLCILLILSSYKLNEIKKEAMKNALEEDNMKNQQIGGNQSGK